MKYIRNFTAITIFIFIIVFSAINSSAESISVSSIFLPIMNIPNAAPPNIAFELVVGSLPTRTITDIVSDGSIIFILYKEGNIHSLDANGNIHSDSFLDLSNIVSMGNWEEGLMNMVFHPDYPSTPYVYVSFTRQPNNQLVIGRYTVSSENPRKADIGSWVEYLAVNKPSEVHHAGDLEFGPDGYLYIAVGDGGPDPVSTNDGDPHNHGQRLDVLMGKILRIDIDSTGNIMPSCGNTNNYRIPADNPYVGESGCNEIWASGLRNPWRISIDDETNSIFIGDVGEWQQEEVNIVSLDKGIGGNFGWRCYEGVFDYTTIQPNYIFHCQNIENYIEPVLSYDNGPFNSGLPCSVIGGLVYRGNAFSELKGQYVFGDFCDNSIRVLTDLGDDLWEHTNYGDNHFAVTTFGEGPNGEVYAGSFSISGNSGAVYKLIKP